jgi:hypothetical protein
MMATIDGALRTTEAKETPINRNRISGGPSAMTHQAGQASMLRDCQRHKLVRRGKASWWMPYRNGAIKALKAAGL